MARSGRPKQVASSAALPTREACALARELALLAAFDLILPVWRTRPLAEMRDLGGKEFAPLRAAPFIAFGALSLACPDVSPAAVAGCLGLDRVTAAGVMARSWSGKDWFRVAVEAVARKLGARAAA